jgi:hypothetical protein
MVIAVNVIGAEKDAGVWFKDKTMKKKWRTTQTRKRFVWQLQVGPWIRVE